MGKIAPPEMVRKDSPEGSMPSSESLQVIRAGKIAPPEITPRDLRNGPRLDENPSERFAEGPHPFQGRSEPSAEGNSPCRRLSRIPPFEAPCPTGGCSAYPRSRHWVPVKVVRDSWIGAVRPIRGGIRDTVLEPFGKVRRPPYRRPLPAGGRRGLRVRAGQSTKTRPCASVRAPSNRHLLRLLPCSEIARPPLLSKKRISH